jgi:ubiquinone/menaquinone biosynthesis C-methylase UbiE
MISKFIHLLRCPQTHERLYIKDNNLSSSNNIRTYKIDKNKIILFANNKKDLHQDSIAQQEHYDKIYRQYIKNIEYPHTKAYTDYLDKKFINSLKKDLGVCAEICCGHGEIPSLIKNIKSCIGIDISYNMLQLARERFPNNNYLLAQADATNLPLQSNKFDSVFMLGGIHHVNDRNKLFSEINRILKPGGRLYFREPANDFFLWKFLRHIIYFLSSGLDHKTERPIIYNETVPILKNNDFTIKKYSHTGFLGFCIFMNSDILHFNKLFRFIPGIKKIVKIFTKIDDLLLKIPAFKKMGLQVIAVAIKNT